MNEEKNRVRKGIEETLQPERGITLVALVITIIIIIILATVAINMAFGENGLINRAEDAGKMYVNDTEYTEESLANVESYINDILAGTGGSGENPDKPPKPIKPTGVISFEEPTWEGNGTASVIITTDNTKDELQYQINGVEEGKWIAISSGEKITGLKHNNNVYGRLWNGEEESDHASTSVKDTIAPNAPTVAVSGGTAGTNSWYTSNVTVKITTGADSQSGVNKTTYTISGAQTKVETTITSGGTISITADGTSTITAYTYDNAGLKSVAKTLTVKKDAIAPTVSIATSNITYNSAKLTVTASDEQSGLATSGTYKYYLDSESTPKATSETNSYNYTGLVGETSYTLKVAVTDNSGLSKEASTTIKTTKKPVTNVSDLKEGEYVNYVDKTGVTRKCVVLYGPENANYSSYGVQIITMDTVEDVTLGVNGDFTASMNQYNDVINILNNATSKYLNTTYASSVRCVGSVPNNPSYDGAGMHTTQFGGNYSGKLKDTDENYLTDWNQMNSLNIHNLGKDYWLASRDVIFNSNTSRFHVRYVYYYGGLSLGIEDVCGMGSLGQLNGYSYTRGLRQCFTLKSGIKVIGGNGTESSPYTLGV